MQEVDREKAYAEASANALVDRYERAVRELLGGQVAPSQAARNLIAARDRVVEAIAAGSARAAKAQERSVAGGPSERGTAALAAFERTHRLEALREGWLIAKCPGRNRPFQIHAAAPEDFEGLGFRIPDLRSVTDAWALVADGKLPHQRAAMAFLAEHSPDEHAILCAWQDGRSRGAAEVTDGSCAMQIRRVRMKEEAVAALRPSFVHAIEAMLSSLSCRAKFPAVLARTDGAALDRCREILLERLVPKFLEDDGVNLGMFEFQVSTDRLSRGRFWLSLSDWDQWIDADPAAPVRKAKKACEICGSSEAEIVGRRGGREACAGCFSADREFDGGRP